MSRQLDGPWGAEQEGAPGTGRYWPRLSTCAFSASSKSHADLGRDTLYESKAFPWVLAHVCPGPQLCPPVSKPASSLTGEGHVAWEEEKLG